MNKRNFNWGELRGGGLNRRVLFHSGTFAQIVSLDNLFLAWKSYRKGKRGKKDVQRFEFNLEDNIFQLHEDLVSGQYRPSGYQQFRITDPKSRLISKASVRDRLFHQAIYQILYPEFDKTFIFDSYSCRNKKGTHRAFNRLVTFTHQVSRNYTRPCWALKLDIKKFFDSIDHHILRRLLRERITDPDLLHHLYMIIGSFEFSPGKGMPLGNLTSQLFANVYMDPLDNCIKHELKVKHYLRYADDFMILSTDPHYLLGCLVEIDVLLKAKLKLRIHPSKVTLRKLSEGIDFVGYVALPHYQLPRRKTVKRLLRNLKVANATDIEKSLPSCLGHLGHVCTNKLLKKFHDFTPQTFDF